MTRHRPGSRLALMLMTATLAASHVAAATPERVWLGPELFANRLQDWRRDGTRLECTEMRPRFPLRTVIRLTESASPRPGTLSMTVVIGARGDVPVDAFAGFVLGAGGEHVDYRQSALVHHRSAEDGGLLAVVDGAGRVALRDNTRSAGAGSRWSLSGPLLPTDAVVLPPTETAGVGFGDAVREPIRLRLDVASDTRGRYTLRLHATGTDSGETLSRIQLDDVAATQVDGAIGIVSHQGGHWFDEWQIEGTKVQRHPSRRFGPVLGTMFTASSGTLALTAQMGPLGDADPQTATLEIERDGTWRPVATATLARPSNTFSFRVSGWWPATSTPFRVVYDLLRPDGTERTIYGGRVPAEPTGPLVLAALSCQKSYTGHLAWNETSLWFPHAEIAEAVARHDPDLLYFAGDQIYEGDLTPAQRQPLDAAILDYHSKWMRHLWAFGDLMRTIPTICVPDDHDVYHGNLWGAGGRRARKQEGMTAQDSGGYVMTPSFVNAVHTTQTSHLPEPVDPTPTPSGISVYFTEMDYGGVGFAILSDRQFKSSPTVTIAGGQVVNGWFQNPQFDPATEADVPNAVLLGDRQLRFLERWAATSRSGVWAKAALSQTIFANLATIPAGAKTGGVLPGLPIPEPGEYPAGYRLAADCDSGGWPQSGRNAALRLLRLANAIHIAGDQHLGATLQYGIDTPGDAAWAFSVPAIANTWPRRWFPPEPGTNRSPDAPPYTGVFRDGFGNLMTVYAVANPVRTGREPARLHDTAPGFGIVRFDPGSRTVAFECWPRSTAPGTRPYPGWPITIDLDRTPARAR